MTAPASLGWMAVAWMEYFVVHSPGDVQGEPVRHGDEYTGFVVDCYAVDDGEGRLLYDSAFFSRPKGCDKSGLGARIGLFEAFGPARFAGWAEGGEVYRDPWGLGFGTGQRPCIRRCSSVATPTPTKRAVPNDGCSKTTYTVPQPTSMSSAVR